MLFLVLLAFYNIHVGAWKISNLVSLDRILDTKSDHGEFQNFDGESSFTGRIFVTLFGYPSRCEIHGYSHPCTLSVACWWVGGSSREGCGANPWLVACCVTSKKTIYVNKIDNKEEEFQILGSSNEDVTIQRRNDENEENCGLTPSRMLLKRIIGGKQASFAQFPWQAHIKIFSYQCGGVLVSPRYVATAAHCVIKAAARNIFVYLGELDTQNTGNVIEYAPSEKYSVNRIIVHPKFEYKVTQPDRYDLALLELSSQVNQAFHILPICLPESGINLEGRTAVVAGWGKVKPSTDLAGTNVLQSAEVPILDIKECMSWHKMKDINVELYEDMVCAGHKDGHKDACLGDSGGPLIVSLHGHWTLVGIISAGFGCGEPNQPGIYHSVAITADWIRSIIYS